MSRVPGAERPPTTALALFSGGLDSILACRLVAAQGIRVRALKFVSPFFGYDLLARAPEYCREIMVRYGVELALHDVSARYLAMLRQPAHGYGRHFNPCVDCKILLLDEARRLMPSYGASLLITGEVIGQRPMSQRRDTLRVIERDSGCRGMLVRPLCAKQLDPTGVELAGLIDRERLLGFRGRGRAPQIELAARFGITDFPSPAGGCVLTDPNLAARIRCFHEIFPVVTVNDMLLLQVGRHFLLPGGGWLAVGRREGENDALHRLCRPEDHLLVLGDRPGPTAVLRHAGGDSDVLAAAAIAVRYSRNRGYGSGAAPVLVCKAGRTWTLMALPVDEAELEAWRR